VWLLVLAAFHEPGKDFFFSPPVELSFPGGVTRYLDFRVSVDPATFLVVEKFRLF
jgi:hypothetical protein